MSCYISPWERLHTFERCFNIIWSLAIPFLMRNCIKTHPIIVKMPFKYYKFQWGSLKSIHNPNELSHKKVSFKQKLHLVPEITPVFEIWKSIQKWLRYERFSDEKSNQKFSGKMHASGCNFYIIRNIFPKAINLCRIDLGTFQLALRFWLLC